MDDKEYSEKPSPSPEGPDLTEAGVTPVSSSAQSTQQKETLMKRFLAKNKKKTKKDATVDVQEEDPLAHLPEHEQVVLRRQLDAPPVKVSYATLFKFSTTNDKLIMVLGSIGAIGGYVLSNVMSCL